MITRKLRKESACRNKRAVKAPTKSGDAPYANVPPPGERQSEAQSKASDAAEPQQPRPGGPRIANRAALNGIWDILWTGCPWKVVHCDWFGVSSSALHERFRTRPELGVWDKVFQVLVKL